MKSIETRLAPAAKHLRMSCSVRQELLARVARHLVVEGVQERQHRGGDDRLLQGLGRHLHRLLDVGRGEGLVPERSAGQARQLTVVAVGEDREVLAIPGEVVGEARARQRVSERMI